MKIENLNIRLAESKYAEELGELYYDTVRTVNAKDYTAKEIGIWSESGKRYDVWRKKIAEQYFIVAESGDKIVGISSIDKDGYLDYMYVHKDHQRQGIAKELLIRIEEKAVEQSNDEIWAYVSITANPFFEKNGYVFSGEKIVAVRGVEFRDRIMKKKLS